MKRSEASDSKSLEELDPEPDSVYLTSLCPPMVPTVHSVTLIQMDENSLKMEVEMRHNQMRHFLPCHCNPKDFVAPFLTLTLTLTLLC